VADFDEVCAMAFSQPTQRCADDTCAATIVIMALNCRCTESELAEIVCSRTF
jgi:hypothetical protein